jgi:exopolyphosphatase/guanosine-5'-triphosphate,3'-diphosphate pyrophosphatase
MKIASIDIGSNSTHMVIVRAEHGQHLEIVDREKEVTRLGAGLRDHRLAKDAVERTLLTLRRFKQMAQANRAELIITTATAAVRESQNPEKFIDRVRKEVGLDVQLLPGVEEARLIALAVSEVTDFYHRRALIVDIGGGSTEFIITSGGEPELLRSVRLGAVSLTEKFIKKDPPSKSEIETLVTSIRADLARVIQEVKEIGFDFVIGTSGTILNMTDTIVESESVESDDELDFDAFSQTITLEQVRKLNRKLAKMDIHERRNVPGIEEKRADIIIAGGLLLETILAELGASEMTKCDWALREGVVLDHLHKNVTRQVTATEIQLFDSGFDDSVADVRMRSVLSVARHFEYDAPHSHLVAKLAMRIFDDTRALHGLGEAERKILHYAAILHDIGYRVAQSDHHRHGLYLIKNSEMPGFTANEIAMIATVVKYHRGSMPKKAKHKREKREHIDYFSMKRNQRTMVLKLAAILQVADGLDRSHSQRVNNIYCLVNDKKVVFKIDCANCDLELWSAERKAKWFTNIFKIDVSFESEPSSLAQLELNFASAAK